MDEERNEMEPETFSNYQFPIRKFERETFTVVLVKKNFLILSDKDGNNTRVRSSSSNLYSILENLSEGQKIYKENGIFLWEKK